MIPTHPPPQTLRLPIFIRIIVENILSAYGTLLSEAGKTDGAYEIGVINPEICFTLMILLKTSDGALEMGFGVPMMAFAKRMNTFY